MAIRSNNRGRTSSPEASQPGLQSHADTMSTSTSQPYQQQKQAATMAAASIASRRGIKPTQEQISQRAKVIWQAKGCPQGMDVPIWLQAERELKRESGIQ